MNIEIFPDYCSTALWDQETRCSIDVTEIDPTSDDTVAQALFAGLRQWHWIWEYFLEGASESALATWRNDGAAIVAALNQHYAGTHTFIYRKDLLEA